MSINTSYIDEAIHDLSRSMRLRVEQLSSGSYYVGDDEQGRVYTLRELEDYGSMLAHGGRANEYIIDEVTRWHTQTGRAATASEIAGEDKPEWLTAKQLGERLSVSRVTLWRWVKAGQLPEPVSLGPRAKRWRQSEIEAWERSQG